MSKNNDVDRLFNLIHQIKFARQQLSSEDEFAEDMIIYLQGITDPLFNYTKEEIASMPKNKRLYFINKFEDLLNRLQNDFSKM